MRYNKQNFTSAVDAEDPMMIVKLDISNSFDSLYARLVWDVCLGRLLVIIHVVTKLMKISKQSSMI